MQTKEELQVQKEDQEKESTEQEADGETDSCDSEYEGLFNNTTNSEIPSWEEDPMDQHPPTFPPQRTKPNAMLTHP